MLRRTVLIALLLCVSLPVVGAGVAAADDTTPPGGSAGAGCNAYGCGLNAYSPGSPPSVQNAAQPVAANVGDAGADPGSEGGGTGSAPVDPGACVWKALPSSPAAGSPLWGGNDPAGGTLEYTNCLTIGGALQTPYRYVANAAAGTAVAAPAVPPPPTPEEVAQLAYEKLPIPVPVMHVGPDAEHVAVNFWTVLWVDNPGTINATATAGAVSVTATAALTSVTWSMGEPKLIPGASEEDVQRWPPACTVESAPTVTFTCPGAGAPSPPADQLEVGYEPAWPTYGYNYRWRSLSERTNGTGAWPVTATATWTITWQANVGATGSLTHAETSTTSLKVGEYRTTRGTGG